MAEKNVKTAGNLKRIFGLSRKKVIILIIILVIVIIFLRSFIVYVKPNEYGIKQINVGIKTGIMEEKFETGFHFLMPFGLHVMHRFPRDIQVFEMTAFPDSASSNARQERAAHIQTSDGFYVDVDVSILYRITDPYVTINTIGPGKLYEDNGIIPKVEPKLKESLGTLTTEEFFNSPLRVSQAEHAKELLNTELNPKGIKVEHVLIRYFVYSEEIQKNIEAKKLQDQMVFTNQSKTKASEEFAIVDKLIKEGEAYVKIRLEEGNRYVTEKIADRDEYVRTKNAEADLLIKLAEAKKTDLINKAYQQQGSDILVGLEMAEVYKGLEVIMLPSSGRSGMNPLDLEGSLQIFGIE